tara:strand:- start:79 stop:900 length:822 start_codon:yes stop_codon:yes gene_type:complete
MGTNISNARARSDQRSIDRNKDLQERLSRDRLRNLQVKDRVPVGRIPDDIFGDAIARDLINQAARQDRLRDLQSGFEQAYSVNTNLTPEARGGLGGYDPGSAGDEMDTPQGIANLFQSSYMAPQSDPRFMAAENNPMAKYTNPFVDVLAGMQTNPRTGEKFDMTNTQDRYDFFNLTQDTVAREKDLSKQRQSDDDRADRARLAAQPQTPDPCPEGYRLDPMSQICVPTDDTTDTTPGTGRVYETMVAPQENYTQVTAPLNIPKINLPDIFTGN